MSVSKTIHYTIKSPHLSHQKFDDETVIVDLECGSYYSLNRVGTDLWSLLERACTADEMKDEISDRYDGDVLEIQDAVDRFLVELQQAGLVETVGTPPVNGLSVADKSRPPLTTKPRFEVPILSTYTDMQELLMLDPIHEVDESGWPSASVEALHAAD